jgi:predicted permease
MDRLFQDLQFGWRQLRRSPAFTVVTTLTLAFGIAANMAIFTVAHAVLLRPLPYKDPERLVAIWDHSLREKALSKIFASYADFQRFEQDARSLETVAAATWAVAGHVLTGRGPAREIMVMPVSASFFDLLGVRPSLGRTFTKSDRAGGCSLVLSHGLWRDTLNADRNVIGQSLILNQQACTVLGVMPPTFAFYPSAAAAWILLTPDFAPPPDQLPIAMFGRLRPGVARSVAESELATLHSALHRQDGRERDVPAVHDLQGELTWLAGRKLRTTLLMLWGAVALVLLIVCLNVATLLLGRSMSRDREMAVRVAVGAERRRIVRQLLTESLLLSALGAACGIAATFVIVSYLRASNLIELPPSAHLTINTPVLLFAAITSGISALCFGFAPAMATFRTDVHQLLKARIGGGRASRHSWSRVLLAIEVAGALVLLVGAGLLMRSVLKMGSAPLGFDAHQLVTARVTLPRDRYANADRRLLFYDELRRALGKQPGVHGVAVASSLPPMGAGTGAIEIRGRTAANQAVHDVAQQTVSADYFDVLGMTLSGGRFFEERDRVGVLPVAIVNEALVHEYFPGQQPIGQQIRLADQDAQKPWLTIVGVVSNEKRTTVYQEMTWVESPALFLALAQNPPASVAMAIRVEGNTPTIGAGLVRIVAAMDADVPVSGADLMDHRLARILAYPEIRARLSSAFAIFALGLAATGLYGVLLQFIAQRRHEIGIRRAIGASTSDIVRLVAREGGVPIIIGLAAGVALSVMMPRYFSSLLYGVRPGDPATLGGSILAITLVGALAIGISACRAARLDPMQILRND